ncbi:MAG TPA: TIR domain-containing protein [Rhizomicrobium sp.]|nr:TIR domain-containing protein [Rhizomicrobium sp.]
MQKKVFISSSSKDNKVAQAICAALEARGHCCWVSGRDVAPGENFQGAIVRAIRDAGAMVVVFSSNANNSEEIKKELALASQSRLIVIPVRAEDVVPGEDFTYELATRQWVDLFEDWERSIEQLGRKLDGIIPRAIEPWPVCAMEMMETAPKPVAPDASTADKPAAPRDHNPLPQIIWGTIAALALIVAASAWLRPPAAPQHLAVAQAAPVQDPVKLDHDLWDAVKDSGNSGALNSYLAKFPHGVFAAAAEARLASLSKPAAPVAPAPTAPVKTAAKTLAPQTPAPQAMAMPMPMAMPKSTNAMPGMLNSNVQMAVDMARSAETRAREMAQNGEQALKLAQAGTPGYGLQTVHNGVQWAGHLAALQTGSAGVITYANGARYAGGTRGGHRDGVGVFAGTPSLPFRERVGEFVADQMSGYGVVYRNDGRVRIGQWKGGVADGYGATYDAQGHAIEQGLYVGDKLAAPLAAN